VIVAAGALQPQPYFLPLFTGVRANLAVMSGTLGGTERGR
jgi:hypothetical protein